MTIDLFKVDLALRLVGLHKEMISDLQTHRSAKLETDR